MSPDELDVKPDNFFWVTYSQVVQVHPGIKTYCLYEIILGMCIEKNSIHLVAQSQWVYLKENSAYCIARLFWSQVC